MIGDTRFEGQPGACEESPDDRRYAALVPAGSVSRALNFLHPRNSHSRGFLPDSDEADIERVAHLQTMTFVSSWHLGEEKPSKG